MYTTARLLNLQLSGNIFPLDTCSHGGEIVKNLYWRSGVLWCSYSLPGYPAKFSLKIKTTGTREDRRVCERAGMKILTLLQTRHIEGTLFNYREFKLRVKQGTLFSSFGAEEHKPYRPKFWRIVGRYWCHHLRHKKSGPTDKYHLMHCLKKFGRKFADEIETHEVVQWLEGMKKNGVAINTINLRLTYMQAAFNYANEKEIKFCVEYNPVRRIEKLKGANVRNFLLTPAMFERNYLYLKKDAPRFALYYLALWETGRRPAEVAGYEWDMYDVNNRTFNIPARLNKANVNDVIPFSDRLHDALMEIEINKRIGLIFPNNCGNPFVYWNRHGEYRNNNQRYIKLLRKKFGNVGVIRDTRRGFVTRKVDEENHRLEDVMLMTGHTTISTAKRYRIGSIEAKRKVVDNNPTPPDDLPKNVLSFPSKLG